ncbi:hypothetical protein CFOL_v3_26695 [Cephalotus follicularis]|uniref:Uncharacterized protein n=1 Tax=Cephalotus follicularis TaxID=3775 RepID=A0A1Q3CSP2_CEPFO|nr:hypothetical protein CFOL_v3_26695 [Cephalotus follicularis]
MSTPSSIVTHNFSCLQSHSCCRFRAILLNYNCCLVASKQNMTSHYHPGYQRLRGLGVQNASNMKMNMVVYTGVEPGPTLPPDPSHGSCRKFWILGMLLSVVFPFWRSKWGPLLKLKNEIETAVETAEHVTEIVEKVAEEVEKVAEEVADKLPEGGELKGVVKFVENVAKETDKDAHLAEEVIEKVEEIEKEVESLVEPVATNQANKIIN